MEMVSQPCPCHETEIDLVLGELCDALRIVFDRSDVLCVFAVVVNFLASAIALRGVSGDGIEE